MKSLRRQFLLCRCGDQTQLFFFFCTPSVSWTPNVVFCCKNRKKKQQIQNLWPALRRKQVCDDSNPLCQLVWQRFNKTAPYRSPDILSSMSGSLWETSYTWPRVKRRDIHICKCYYATTKCVAPAILVGPDWRNRLYSETNVWSDSTCREISRAASCKMDNRCVTTATAWWTLFISKEMPTDGRPWEVFWVKRLFYNVGLGSGPTVNFWPDEKGGRWKNESEICLVGQNAKRWRSLLVQNCAWEHSYYHAAAHGVYNVPNTGRKYHERLCCGLVNNVWTFARVINNFAVLFSVFFPQS